jgi:hypothetical protein
MPERKQRASDNSIPCCESPSIIYCACGATAERRVLRQPYPSFTAMSKRGETLGLASFHAGVTRAAVVVRSVGAEDVEAALLALRSAER